MCSNNTNCIKSFYDTGELRSEEFYFNNQLHGISRTWYKNGILASQSFFNKGIQIGESKRWHYNSNLSMSEFYNSEGLRQGYSTIWDENNKLLFRNLYENGNNVHPKYMRIDNSYLKLKKLTI